MTMYNNKTTLPEILAPVGGSGALAAALAAGADAVYFGLANLNARRRAKNFLPDELQAAVKSVHDAGAKVYLAMNIDLSERELGQTARALELSKECGVDALIIRDPAILCFRDCFPDLELHFSTQTCMTNSADVTAARELGVSRAILARELSLDEIRAASAVDGIETEVFCHGALCFCVSGRCLLSSWGGGRSGNRGSCVSPCRAPWKVAGREAGTPLSMHEFFTADRIAELAAAGVSCLKIEGRLKKPEWGASAVDLYKKALGGEEVDFSGEGQRLAAYSGRQLSSAYLDGKRDDLTGGSGRESSSGGIDAPEGDAASHEEDSVEEDKTYLLEIMAEEKGIRCSFSGNGEEEEWKIPATVVRRAKKALNIVELFEYLESAEIHGFRLGKGQTNIPEQLLAPRSVNAIGDRVSAILHRSLKPASSKIKLDLPEAVAAVLQKGEPCADNKTPLGRLPDRVRLHARNVESFFAECSVKSAVVEGLTPAKIDRLVSGLANTEITVALPPVFFEHEIPMVREIAGICAKSGVRAEVNSWGGWLIAREAGASFEAGPGMAVLNTLAAKKLQELGALGVAMSVEADRQQLESMSENMPLASSITVYGYPRLMVSRVRLAEEMTGGKVFQDRRGISMLAEVERGLTCFYPVNPFNIVHVKNNRIRACHLVADLVGAQNPVEEWNCLAIREKKPFKFNYDGSLA